MFPGCGAERQNPWLGEMLRIEIFGVVDKNGSRWCGGEEN
jgi:hypothetical protein